MQHNFLYSVEREYTQPMSRIWEAWTDAAQLEAWYHPTVLANVPGSSVSEPVVGGAWAIAVDVPEAGFQSCFWGTYTALEPGKLIEHTMYYSQDPAEFAAKISVVNLPRSWSTLKNVPPVLGCALASMASSQKSTSPWLKPGWTATSSPLPITSAN